MCIYDLTSSTIDLLRAMQYTRFFVLGLVLALTATAAHAQDVPASDAVPDPVPDAPRPQVISAITGQLPGPASSPSTDAGAAPRALEQLGALWPLLGGAAHDALQTALQGNGNAAYVHQEGSFNTAHITQRGRANAAIMIQQGSGNTSRLLQEGTHNVYGSWLQGDDNVLNIEQIGSGNAYLFGFQGNRLHHSVQQVGTGIRAVQVGTGHAPFGIQQHGNGMDIIIRHNGAQ